MRFGSNLNFLGAIAGLDESEAVDIMVGPVVMGLPGSRRNDPDAVVGI